MKRTVHAITKQQLDAMSLAEKGYYLTHMLDEMNNVEVVNFIVCGFSEKDLKVEELELNVEDGDEQH